MAHPLSITTDEQRIRDRALTDLGKRIRDLRQLPQKIVELLADQLLLLEIIEKGAVKEGHDLVDVYDHSSGTDHLTGKTRELFGNYSFLISPAYKAFEGYLIFIAGELGLPVDQYKQKIGKLYNWDEVEEAHSKLVKQIQEILKRDEEGVERWRELGMALKQYRHNPAHFLGDSIDSFEEAEQYVMTIINVINRTTRYLLENGFIENRDRINER